MSLAGDTHISGDYEIGAEIRFDDGPASAPIDGGISFVGADRCITNPATGLIHMGARMYKPKLGRFLSRDPITGGSANDYEYTSGDPINRLDVSGMTHSCNSWHRPDLCNQGSEDEICQFVVERDLMDAAAFYCHTTSSGGGVKRVRGKGGNVFVISTRTGRLMAVDLGASYVPRKIVDWGDIGKSAGYQFPGGQIYARYKDPAYSTSPSGALRVGLFVGKLASGAKVATWPLIPMAMVVGGVYSWSGQCAEGYCALW